MAKGRGLHYFPIQVEYRPTQRLSNLAFPSTWFFLPPKSMRNLPATDYSLRTIMHEPQEQKTKVKT